MITQLKASLVRLANRIAEAGSVEIDIPVWVFYSLIGYIALRILRRPIAAILSAIFSVFTYLGRLAAELLLGLSGWMAGRVSDRLSYIRDNKGEIFSRLILVLVIIILLTKLNTYHRTRHVSKKTVDTETAPH